MTPLAAVYVAGLVGPGSLILAAVWASGRPQRGHRAPTRLHTLGTALRHAGEAFWRGVLWLRLLTHERELTAEEREAVRVIGEIAHEAPAPPADARAVLEPHWWLARQWADDTGSFTAIVGEVS